MVQTKGLQEKDPLIGRGKLKEVSKDCEVINNQQQQNPNYLWTKWTREELRSLEIIENRCCGGRAAVQE